MGLSKKLKNFIKEVNWIFAKTYAGTPFWLSIVEIQENWITTEKFKRKCKKIASILNHKFVEMNNEIFIALKPKLDEVEDVVINDLVNQIEQILSKRKFLCRL